MSIDIGVEEILSGGGAPAAKFPTPGTTIKGTISDAIRSQQTDLDGKPKTWDDGNPRMQLVITVQTDERDSSLDDDDGVRRIFVKGQMLSALKEALKKASVKTIEVGGTIAVQYAKDGDPTKVGFNAPKVYVVQYKIPTTTSLGVDELI